MALVLPCSNIPRAKEYALAVLVLESFVATILVTIFAVIEVGSGLPSVCVVISAGGN